MHSCTSTHIHTCRVELTAHYSERQIYLRPCFVASTHSVNHPEMLSERWQVVVVVCICSLCLCVCMCARVCVQHQSSCHALWEVPSRVYIYVVCFYMCVCVCGRVALMIQVFCDLHVRTSTMCACMHSSWTFVWALWIRALDFSGERSREAAGLPAKGFVFACFNTVNVWVVCMYAFMYVRVWGQRIFPPKALCSRV